MTEPSIIRQNKPHEITVTEGSQVATSRNLDPNAPQVRRTLSTDPSQEDLEPTWDPKIPPAIAASQGTEDAPVFERQAGISGEGTLEVPDALSRSQQDDAIVFERSIQDADDPEAPVISRNLEDRWETLPPEIERADDGQGPVFERSSSDHFVTAPEALPAAPGPDGPALSRQFQDRFVPAPPREGSTPPPPATQTLPPPSPRAPIPPGAASRVLPRGRTEPAPPPMPAEQAQAMIVETARQAQAKVEETLGAADSSWVEMDFPARVVRLKIENDKVRSKLEQLDRLTRQAMP